VKPSASWPSRGPDRNWHCGVCVEFDSFGKRMCHDIPDDDTRFAAGMLQNGMFSKDILDSSNVLARESVKRSTSKTCVAHICSYKVPSALTPDLELASTPLGIPPNSEYRLWKLYGYRWPAVTAKHQMYKQPMMEGGRSYCCPAWCMLSSALYVLQGLASLPPLFFDWNPKLPFVVPLSLLTSDHLFWGGPSAPRHVDLCAIPCARESPCEPRVCCCNRLPTRFPAHTHQRQRRQPCSPEKLRVSLLYLLNSVQHTSVLGIAWMLIAAGGFGPVLDNLALLCLLRGGSAVLTLDLAASARVFDVV
jgi:hypothetical protein